MQIGIPKEIKNNENRVGLPPSGVHALVQRGHSVVIEQGQAVVLCLAMPTMSRQGRPSFLMPSLLGKARWLSRSKNRLSLNMAFFETI